MIPLPDQKALQALERLKQGNARFASGRSELDTTITTARRQQLLAGQQPSAVILGCADSRVPVELIFDQGLGELFVIRVAGNVVASSQVGSIEFAAEQFGTRLVVVLGHQDCGAVDATLKELRQPSENRSRGLSSIVNRIRPAVEVLLETDLKDDEQRLLRQAVRANVRVSANFLRHGSAILERMVEEEGMIIVGAEYSMETGQVEFFDGLPASD